MTSRWPGIDWFRGVAIALMVIYHFCYDLYFFGYLDTAFGKGNWVYFRSLIVWMFLLLVGIAMVLSYRGQINWTAVKTRSIKLLVAAALVTLSSVVIAPNKITVFGILHFILVASILVLPLVNRPWIALFLGSVIIVLGHLITNNAFDPVQWHWIGMVATKRPSLDYVPIFPWLGVVLVGIALGHVCRQQERLKNWLHGDFFEIQKRTYNSSLHVKLTLIQKINGLITKAGRHSLIIYLVHQPVLFGGFLLVNWGINS